MPATVHVSESTRASMRVIITIAALVVLLVPIAFSVAHGASRLNYTNLEVTKKLPTSTKDLNFVLDTGASIVVKTTDTTEPSVRLTATGPRDETPKLQVRGSDNAATVSVDDHKHLEKSRIEVLLPAETSKDMKLDFNGGYGGINISGDYQEIVAKTDGGAVEVSGSAETLQTATDYGMTQLSGTFDTIESKTGVGTLNGSNLNVRDHVDAVTSTGTIDLDFTNDMVPMSGIVAKADEGTIDIRLPRLDLAQERMAAEAAASKDDDGSAADAKDLFYRINANSNEGSVDLAKDVKKYDAARSSKDAEGKTIIPVSASTDMGTITIEQN
ncbi:DUF4097 family beta strand repeat-containing protein [Brevibacterium aurantiacum]|uniref:Uncharacterized protein n=1 Tax=Brevibacterium aurantiacum TaxID=273384 RepID=A0A2H1KHK7_BREAU|nr:hypothetical protein [Brevibacterium aurantiacum]MDN5608956.1 hypothetical protein [Brevibacterium sp.]RCS98338.1 hypothetical protein CIK61_00835 [Brevibacterium aurantiacum]SMX99243.1 hypothetical protein BAUR920_03217 [Brevibacterium aurantiacum]